MIREIQHCEFAVYLACLFIVGAGAFGWIGEMTQLVGQAIGANAHLEFLVPYAPAYALETTGITSWLPTMLHILLASRGAQIFQQVMPWSAVSVIGLEYLWEESLRHQIGNDAMFPRSTFAESDAPIAVSISSGAQNFLPDVERPQAWAFDNAGLGSDLPVAARRVKSFPSRNRAPFFWGNIVISQRHHLPMRGGQGAVVNCKLMAAFDYNKGVEKCS